MNLETIKVENLKCGGCAATIKKRLFEITGVKEVEVAPEKASVIVEYEKDGLRETILKVLAAIGYPEQGTGNTLQKIKSYVSCMRGKMGEKGT